MKWNGIFVGIDTYIDDFGIQDSDLNLSAPHYDAERLFHIFSELSDNDHHNLHLLTGKRPEDPLPTRNRIFSTIIRCLEKANHNEPLIVFFAGHAGVFADSFCLLPRDYSSIIPEISGINVNDILRMISIHKGIKLVITDCCRLTYEASSKVEQASLPDLPIFFMSPDTAVITACGHSQYSIEAISNDLCDKPTGIFAYFFADAIRHAILSRRKRGFTLYEVFERARDKTSEYVANLPWDDSNTPLFQIPEHVGADLHNWYLKSGKTM